MTYNIMEDGRFRADLPFFGGKVILNPRAKRATRTAVIDKLVEVGGLLGARADQA